MKRAVRKPSSIEIELARPEDVERISELWGDLAGLHESLDPAFTPADTWQDGYAQYLTGLLGRDDARVLVARRNGDIVAYGIARVTLLPPFFLERRRGFIQDVYTVKGYRRRGIGRKLANALLHWLREVGMETAELTVASGNLPGIHFWRNLGFEVYMHYCKRRLD
jgi:ribosomal protein S18 acetylase RimI-like enzyme